MKVAVITEDYVTPIKGGGGFRAVKCTYEFVKRADNVIVFAPAENDFLDKEKKIRIVKLKHQQQKYSSFKLVFELIAFQFEVFWKLVKERRNIELLFLRSTVPALAVVLFSMVFRKKKFLDITDLQAQYLKQGFFTSIVERFEYFLIRRFSRIVVVSEAMKNDLVLHGVNKNKINVVYDGVDLGLFSAGGNKKYKNKRAELIIIHHGSVNMQDGVELIPKAAAIILKKYPNAKFWIIGSGNKLGDVKGLVDKYGLQKNFLFSGWVPIEVIVKYLDKADIGLVTRTNTRANNMVLTLKLLEYWATENVAIIPALDAMKEVCVNEKNVLFYEPENENDLAEKIMKAITNEKLRLHLTKNGLVHVKNFTWDYLAKQIVDIVYS